MLILQNGRPDDETNRLPKEIRTYDFLDKLNIEYQRIDHEPAMTMEVCAEIDKARIYSSAIVRKQIFICL